MSLTPRRSGTDEKILPYTDRWWASSRPRTARDATEHRRSTGRSIQMHISREKDSTSKLNRAKKDGRCK